MWRIAYHDLAVARLCAVHRANVMQSFVNWLLYTLANNLCRRGVRGMNLYASFSRLVHSDDKFYSEKFRLLYKMCIFFRNEHRPAYAEFDIDSWSQNILSAH